MKNFLKALLFLVSMPLCAQIPSGYVQTTATVPVLANGTYGASWTNLSSSPQLGLLGCVSTFQTTVNGTFDASGHFSVLLADTAQICPTPSTWTFTLTFSCPTNPTSAFQVAVPVTGGGGTENITSQITAALPTNPCSGSGGGGGTTCDLTDIMNINAACFTGSDPGAQISNAFAYLYATKGLDVGGVNACKLPLAGVVAITSNPFASIATASSNFQGLLKICGHLQVANNLLPLIIPNGIAVDGGSTHTFVDPPYPGYGGATIQPATAGYAGVVVTLSSDADNHSPAGITLRDLSVSGLAPGEAYTTTTLSISSCSVSGSSFDYVGTCTATGNAPIVGNYFTFAAGFTELGLAAATPNLQDAGMHLIVQSVSGTGPYTFTFDLSNMVPSISGSETGTATMTSLMKYGVANLDGQEGSGFYGVNAVGVTVGFTWTQDPQNGVGGVNHSSEDSSGGEKLGCSFQNDPNSICLQEGGSPLDGNAKLGSVGAVNIAEISDVSAEGPNSNTSPGYGIGTVAYLEGTNLSVKNLRGAYVHSLGVAGLLDNSNTITFDQDTNAYSNANNALVTLILFGPTMSYGADVINSFNPTIGSTSPAWYALYDARYSSAAPCSVLGSNEPGVAGYTRGSYHGGIAGVNSTTQTGCASVLPADIPTTSANAVITGSWTFQATQFADQISQQPTGTATSGNNFDSYQRYMDGSYYPAGGPAANLGMSEVVNIGTGTTPTFDYYLGPGYAVPGTGSMHIGEGVTGLYIPALALYSSGGLITTNGGLFQPNAGEQIASGQTLTILSGGTLTCAAGSTCPSSGGITLTTTGTSGAATLTGGALNIPVYSGGGGSGTVTSVALVGSGNLFSATAGTAVTSSGNLNMDSQLAAQAANCILAGPASGSSAAPTCRTLVTADLPSGVALTGTVNTFTQNQIITGSGTDTILELNNSSSGGKEWEFEADEFGSFELYDNTDSAAILVATSGLLTFDVPVATPSIAINSGTPITSTSSANSQAVTCPTGGTGTEVCDANGTWIASNTPVTNTTISVGTTTIPANGCLPTNTTYNTASMPGVTTLSTFTFTPAASLASVTGWTPAGPIPYFNAYPTANTLNWQICNNSTPGITPGSSTTWNVSAK